jgi:hypothetical protein
MTAVPLPDVPCLRVRLIGSLPAPPVWGNRFFLSYTGSAPTAANCATLATDIQTAWVAHIASLVPSGYTLNEVDVLDIATDSGKFGTWSGSVAGSRSNAAVPINCAMGVEYTIGRRYRGGKPRIYLVAGDAADVAHPGQWSPGFVAEAQAAFPAFMTQVTGFAVGSIGSLTHVNLSYYKGFTNITTSSGRERAVPKYRDTALHDPVTGYQAKTEVQSQRRRRTSTSP